MIQALPFRIALPLLFPLLTSVEARADDAIPSPVRSILAARCYQCHGQDGKDQGGMGSVFDYAGLVQKGVVVPGHAETSSLVQKIRAGEMPLGGPALDPGDAQAIEDWIAALPEAPAATGGAAPSPANLIPDSQLPKRKPNPSVLAFHAGPRRDGHYAEPSFTPGSVQSLRPAPGFPVEVSGAVYGQLLYVSHGGPGGRDALIAVTETNQVYAFDGATGATLWQKSLGPAVHSGFLPCGNIDPLGITGTPAVDAASNTLVLDSVQTPDQGKTVQHLLYRLSITDGSVQPGWPVDVATALAKSGAVFQAKNQNQRGAVGIVNGVAYVPYGGHFGDCADYHGWIVGIVLNQPGSVRSWKTGAREGGIWAPGGVSSDGQSLFFATGNTAGAKTWSGGEGIFRLPLSLQAKLSADNYFTPANWQQLDEADLDLGGTSPALVDLPGGSQQRLLVGFGKDGNAYVLDRAHPGGKGGALLTAAVAENLIITAPAVYTAKSGTYVAIKARAKKCPAGQDGDLTALRITNSPALAVTTAWCANQDGNGSPIVTTTDGHSNPIVWSLGAEGDGHLRGFDGETGKLLSDTPIEMNEQRYQTPIVVQGKIFVGGQKLVYAFSADDPRNPASLKKKRKRGGMGKR